MNADKFQVVRLLDEMERLGVALSPEDDGGIVSLHSEGVSLKLMAEVGKSILELRILLLLRQVDFNIVGARLNGEYRILTAPAPDSLQSWEKMPRRILADKGED